MLWVRSLDYIGSSQGISGSMGQDALLDWPMVLTFHALSFVDREHICQVDARLLPMRAPCPAYWAIDQSFNYGPHNVSREKVTCRFEFQITTFA